MFNLVGLSFAGFVIAMQLRRATLPGGPKELLFPWLCLVPMYGLAFFKFMLYG